MIRSGHRETDPEFVTLKRKAPGRFSEEMMPLLSEMLNTNNPKLELVHVELGDDPFEEKIEIEVQVPEEATKSVSGGPTLFFTLTSELSPAENLKEFREFVAEHSKVAANPPATEIAVGQEG